MKLCVVASIHYGCGTVFMKLLAALFLLVSHYPAMLYTLFLPRARDDATVSKDKPISPRVHFLHSPLKDWTSTAAAS